MILKVDFLEIILPCINRQRLLAKNDHPRWSIIHANNPRAECLKIIITQVFYIYLKKSNNTKGI